MNKLSIITTGAILTAPTLTGCSTGTETPAQGIIVSTSESSRDIYNSVYECYPSMDMNGNLSSSCGFKTVYDRTEPTVIVNIKSCMPGKQGDQIITTEYARNHANYPSDYPLSNAESIEVMEGQSTTKYSCNSSFEVKTNYGHSLSIGQFVLTGNLIIHSI